MEKFEIKTHDGVLVTPGMSLWINYYYKKPILFKVNSVEKEEHYDFGSKIVISLSSENHSRTVYEFREIDNIGLELGYFYKKNAFIADKEKLEDFLEYHNKTIKEIQQELKQLNEYLSELI